MPDESVAKPDHLYVAHYAAPDAPDAEEARRDTEGLARAERESARQLDYARWRVLRYIAGVFLACVSIAAGAVAILAVVVALTSGSGSVDLVTGIEDSGVSTVTLTSGQLFMLTGAIVALEVVLVWAATLLFSRGLHPGQWVAVGVMAAASTVGVVLGAGSILSGAANLPYLVAFPLIVVASLLESHRIRGLRARWGE
jgi:hypothetical protein